MQKCVDHLPNGVKPKTKREENITWRPGRIEVQIGLSPEDFCGLTHIIFYEIIIKIIFKPTQTNETIIKN